MSDVKIPEAYEPVRLSVLWDGRNVELKLLGALDDLFQRAKQDGLTENGRARVIHYMVGTLTPDLELAAQPIRSSHE